MRAVDLDCAVGLLDQALAATTDPAVRQRIEIHRDGLHYGGYGIWLDDLAKRMMAMSVADRASADRVLALATRQASLLAEAEAFWSQQTPERDDLLGMTLRGWVAIHEKWQDTFIQIARSMALAAAGASVADALDWYTQHVPDELAARTETLKAAHARYAQMAEAVRWARSHRPANLLKNGDFEQPTDASPDFGGAAWTPLGTPAGWIYWARFKEGRWGIVEGRGIKGSKAALLQHDNDSNALNFKQAIPVQLDERYLVIAQTRSASGQPVRADIEIYLATEAQGYYVDQNVNLTAGDAWQLITL